MMSSKLFFKIKLNFNINFQLKLACFIIKIKYFFEKQITWQNKIQKNNTC